MMRVRVKKENRNVIMEFVDTKEGKEVVVARIHTRNRQPLPIYLLLKDAGARVELEGER